MPASGVFSYRVVPGYFSDASEGEQVPPRFGLIDSSPTRWSAFKARIASLNETAPGGTTYRVLFVGRHGQGFHNVAERVYGTVEWDAHWSKLNGDGNITWGPDPKLTALGIQQAELVNRAWRAELACNDGGGDNDDDNGMPLPQSLYSSPFTRALHTALVTFDGILINPGGSKGRPRPDPRLLIKEKLREVNGVHTCDKRSPRSLITAAFPQFDVEPGFTEEDELWTDDHRESEAELASRIRQALDEVFGGDEATYISITAHGGAIRGIMHVIHAPPRDLPTGGVVCFVLEVQRITTDRV